MGRLSGRVAVVTGAAQGLGAAMIARFAAEGATVVGLDLEGDRVQAVLDGLDGPGLAVECDVTRSQQVDLAMERANATFGSLDILVNNAGLTRHNKLPEMTNEDIDAVFAVHLRGSLLCMRAAHRYMAAQHYGKIVMMSSWTALGHRGQINYATAKAGLQGMTRAASVELGPDGINVNAIAPGHIDSAMARATANRMGISYETLKARTIERQPIKRVGRPEDVASLAAFLASDEASYISGQVIYVSGGPGGS